MVGLTLTTQDVNGKNLDQWFKHKATDDKTAHLVYSLCFVEKIKECEMVKKG